ncbi:MAG: VanW family protein [Acidimicrobiia bacterium]|nr:MAG: VanW family protein [Acidimicrobiia bacterium]
MRRILIGIAIGIPVLALVAVAAGFVYDERINEDQVGRSVSAAGVDLSGLSVEEAAAAIAGYEQRLAAEPATFSVDGEQVTLVGSAVGMEVDEDQIAAAALESRRGGGLFADFTGWVSSWWSPVEMAVPITIDEVLLGGVLDEWDRNVIDDPAYEGAVLVDNGVPAPEYPQSGQMIDRTLAIVLIAGSMESAERKTVELPLTDLSPVISAADVDAAVDRARAIVARPVLLSLDGFAGVIVFPSDRLASALTSQPAVNSLPVLAVSLDGEKLIAGLEARFDAFASPAVDATFTFDEDTASLAVVPSRAAIVVDAAALAGAVEAAALGSGRGEIPTTAGDDAAFTTEMAEAMGPITQVSTFTTFHPCCANRVTNIQLLADKVDGAIVMPGDTFSINDRVGVRTLEDGFKRAGAIISGELYCCDSPVNVGGGTSQFATTFYNAVFFSCYEDVEHQPHSLYFSRYPFVREATLGFPKPDVIFRNDSEAIVYVDTSYTAGSITVTFYGNNGGRTCTAERAGNTVTRVMTHPDGSVTRQSWTWFYRSKKTTTTTTTVPETTTTVPGTTTTTTVPGTTTTTVPGTTTTTVPETTTTVPETTTTVPETTTTSSTLPDT